MTHVKYLATDTPRLKDEIMWAESTTGEMFECVHVDFAREQEAEIERLRAGNDERDTRIAKLVEDNQCIPLLEAEIERLRALLKEIDAQSIASTEPDYVCVPAKLIANAVSHEQKSDEKPCD